VSNLTYILEMEAFVYHYPTGQEHFTSQQGQRSRLQVPPPPEQCAGQQCPNDVVLRPLRKIQGTSPRDRRVNVQLCLFRTYTLIQIRHERLDTRLYSFSHEIMPTVASCRAILEGLVLQVLP
jgi:hypothetical protein